MPRVCALGVGVDVGDGDCDMSTWKTRGRGLALGSVRGGAVGSGDRRGLLWCGTNSVVKCH